MFTVHVPLDKITVSSLKSGREILLSGIIYSARDAAHKKLMDLIQAGRPLPFELKNNLIYYTGPTPPPPGKIIGAAGPTTSSRMDVYTPLLYRLGLKATLGKGSRGPEVAAACKKYGALYLVTYGGLGAYLTKFIKNSKLLAFPELGPEAIYRLEVSDFPALVAIDARGKSFY